MSSFVCFSICENYCTLSPPFANWWMGWRFTTSFWAEKKQETFFQISCSMCRCVGGGYLVVKVRDKLALLTKSRTNSRGML